MSRRKIFVAIPTYDGKIFAECMSSVMQLSYSMPRGEVSVFFEVATEIHRGRNTLAANFYSDESYTHLLFIDSDMGFRPSLISKMVRADRPFVGTIYPKRSLLAERMYSTSRVCQDPFVAETCALDFTTAEFAVLENDDYRNPVIRVHDGFIRTSRVGTGILLLQRSVLSTLRERYPHLLIVNAGQETEDPSRMVHQCFAPLQSDSGEFLSEDVSFCERWTKCGGEIWACVDETITHIGPRAFSGDYLTKIKNGMMQVPPRKLEGQSIELAPEP